MELSRQAMAHFKSHYGCLAQLYIFKHWFATSQTDPHKTCWTDTIPATRMEESRVVMHWLRVLNTHRSLLHAWSRHSLGARQSTRCIIPCISLNLNQSLQCWIFVTWIRPQMRMCSYLQSSGSSHILIVYITSLSHYICSQMNVSLAY